MTDKIRTVLCAGQGRRRTSSIASSDAADPSIASRTFMRSPSWRASGSSKQARYPIASITSRDGRSDQPASTLQSRTGILAGVLNSIPYFGPVVVSGGLFVVGIAEGGGISQALQMSGAAIVITSLEGWLITPPLMRKVERVHREMMTYRSQADFTPLSWAQRLHLACASQESAGKRYEEGRSRVWRNDRMR
jgi:hypothetical protein